MRNYFPDHGPQDEAHEKFIHGILVNCIIVLDTSILLNFYRESKESFSAKLTWLKQPLVYDRLYFPYQVLLEFNNNRESVIGDSRPSIGEVEATLKAALRISLDHIKEKYPKNRNRWINFDTIEDLLHSVKSQILLSIPNESVEAASQEDNVYKEIEDLTKNKHGRDFEMHIKENIKEEGRFRFAKNIPPGYKDIKKPEPRRFGDLFVWEDMIFKANMDNKNVVFVTNDTKEDWFEQHPLRGRAELTTEFHNRTGHVVLIRTFEQLQANFNGLIESDIFSPKS